MMRYVNMLLPRCEWREISELWVVLSISAQPVIVSTTSFVCPHTILCLCSFSFLLCLFVFFFDPNDMHVCQKESISVAQLKIQNWSDCFSV